MTYPQIKDWPTDEETEKRMVPFMQNANEGDHYEPLDSELIIGERREKSN
jgi:hypothetical protein